MHNLTLRKRTMYLKWVQKYFQWWINWWWFIHIWKLPRLFRKISCSKSWIYRVNAENWEKIRKPKPVFASDSWSKRCQTYLYFLCVEYSIAIPNFHKICLSLLRLLGDTLQRVKGSSERRLFWWDCCWL